MNTTTIRTPQARRSGLSYLILLLIAGLSAGCASSGSNPEIQRSDSDAVLGTLKCPDNQKPTCVRKTGKLDRCFCSTDADFRRIWDVNL